VSTNKSCICITGASGLIGSALVQRLRSQGNRVLRLTRTVRDPQNDIRWDPKNQVIDTNALQPVDTVIHLAGESIMSIGGWSARKRQAIMDSRVEGTRFLFESLQQLPNLHTIFSASATGYYGDRGAEVLTEESRRGSLFLSDVSERWEHTARQNSPRNSRLVLLRFGAVLSPEGGAFALMKHPFALGAGAVVGSGQQYFPWIHIEDLVSAVEFLLQQTHITGAVNIVAPTQNTHKDFCIAVARALHRPLFLKVPSLVMRLMLPGLAQELLLASQRVKPQKLEEHGFSFGYPDLGSAVPALITRG